MRKKQQEKFWYDKGVKAQYFSPDEFVLLKNSNLHLGKLIEQWHGPFIIDNFDGDHGASYILKILDGKPVPNTYYSDHLRIFCPRERYLQPANEKSLQVICKLPFRKKIDWSSEDISYLLYANCAPNCYMQIVSYRMFYADCFI